MVPPRSRTGAPSRLQDTRGSGTPRAAQGSSTSCPSSTASSTGPAAMVGGTGWDRHHHFHPNNPLGSRDAVNLPSELSAASAGDAVGVPTARLQHPTLQPVLSYSKATPRENILDSHRAGPRVNWGGLEADSELGSLGCSQCSAWLPRSSREARGECLHGLMLGAPSWQPHFCCLPGMEKERTRGFQPYLAQSAWSSPWQCPRGCEPRTGSCQHLPGRLGGGAAARWGAP